MMSCWKIYRVASIVEARVSSKDLNTNPECSRTPNTYLNIIHKSIHLAGFEHREHGLTHVESMAPIVVLDGTIVLLHAQNPLAQHLKKTEKAHLQDRWSMTEAKTTPILNLIRYLELVDQSKLHEHTNCDLESLLVLQGRVIKGVAKKNEVNVRVLTNENRDFFFQLT